MNQSGCTVPDKPQEKTPFVRRGGRAQVSSGSRTVVSDRSHSVMIQNFTPLGVWVR